MKILILLLQLLLILLLNNTIVSYDNSNNDNKEVVDISTYIKSNSNISILELQEELIKNNNLSLNHINDDGSTLLHVLATYNHLNLIQYIINNIDTTTTNLYEYINKQDKYGDTCIHKACFNNFIDIVTFLKMNQADISITTNVGVSPLHSASYKGNDRIVELLVKEYQVPINIKTHSGAVPLHYAVGQGHLSTVILLGDLGANVDEVNKDNITALHIALKQKRIEIARSLIHTFGAKMDIKNNKGETAQDYDILSSVLEKDL